MSRGSRTVAAALAITAAGIGVGFGITAAPQSTAAPYIPCDQWQQMHPGWPCVDVPEPPTQPPVPPTQPPLPTWTPAQPGGGGGTGAGALVPPAPGPGNGTPIVPLPGTGQPAPPGGGPAPAPRNPAPAAPPSAVDPAAPSAEVPAPPVIPPATPPVTPPSPPSGSSGSAVSEPEEHGPDGRIPLLLLAGAAAFTAPILRLRGGRSAHQLTIQKPWGGEQTFILMTDPAAPREYRFPQQLPPGGRLRENPDGSIDVLDADGQPTAHTNPPWAYDALGRPVRTHYRADGDTIVQYIEPDPDNVYPILADPDTIPSCTITSDGHGGTTTSMGNRDGSVTSFHEDAQGNTARAHSVPVPDSGGTVDTRIENADGSTSDVRSVPDGNGGVTTFTRNPDGSHTVQYPDGSFYQEPAAGAEQPIQVQGQVTDTGVQSQFTDSSGNVTTATSTTQPGSSTVHTEYETPSGHASSDSYVQPGATVATQSTTPEGDHVVTVSQPNSDGTVDTQQVVGSAVNADGDIVLLQSDGRAYNPTTGKFEAITDKLLESATNAAPKFLTGQGVSQGSKLVIAQANNLAVAGLIDGSSSWVNGSLTAAEYAAKFGKFAPAVAAPVGMYVDIKNGVDPGEAVTAGVAGAAATIAVAAVLGPGIVPALAAGAVGAGAYYGTRWLYGKIFG